MAGIKALCDAAEPTKAHLLMKMLHERGVLQRWYSQNIDGMEARLLPCFVPGESLSQAENAPCVALHGSLCLVACPKCGMSRPWEQMHTDAFRQGLSIECHCFSSGKDQMPSVLMR